MTDYPLGHQLEFREPGNWDEPDHIVVAILVDIHEDDEGRVWRTWRTTKHEVKHG